MSLDELPFSQPEPDATRPERPPRKCRRHDFVAAADVAFAGPVDWAWKCRRCGMVRDDARTRRGRTNRSRGNSIEREIGKALGLRRVGMFGGPDDLSSEWLVVQVKSGGSFPERVWRWLQALPANAGQTRAVVLTDAPGPGHRRRAVVIVTLEDWRALHGEAT